MRGHLKTRPLESNMLSAVCFERSVCRRRAVSPVIANARTASVRDHRHFLLIGVETQLAVTALDLRYAQGEEQVADDSDSIFIGYFPGRERLNGERALRRPAVQA